LTILLIFVAYYIVRAFYRIIKIWFNDNLPKSKNKSDVFFENTDQPKKRISKDKGEYVDYEEID